MKIITPLDPLHALREDIFSNDDINQMTGKMIREQYIEDQVIEPTEEPES